jgi:hypothetical protein
MKPKRKPTRAMIDKARHEHARLNKIVYEAFWLAVDSTPHALHEGVGDIIRRAAPELREPYQAACKAHDAFENECIERGLAWRSVGWLPLNWY